MHRAVTQHTFQARIASIVPSRGEFKGTGAKFSILNTKCSLRPIGPIAEKRTWNRRLSLTAPFYTHSVSRPIWAIIVHSKELTEPCRSLSTESSIVLWRTLPDTPQVISTTCCMPRPTDRYKSTHDASQAQIINSCSRTCIYCIHTAEPNTWLCLSPELTTMSWLEYLYYTVEDRDSAWKSLGKKTASSV